MEAGLFLLLLAVPIALNVHTPAAESFVKSVPLLGSSSNLKVFPAPPLKQYPPLLIPPGDSQAQL